MKRPTEYLPIFHGSVTNVLESIACMVCHADNWGSHFFSQCNLAEWACIISICLFIIFLLISVRILLTNYLMYARVCAYDLRIPVRISAASSIPRCGLSYACTRICMHVLYVGTALEMSSENTSCKTSSMHYIIFSLFRDRQTVWRSSQLGSAQL